MGGGFSKNNVKVSDDGRHARLTGKGTGPRTSVAMPVKPKTNNIDNIQIPSKNIVKENKLNTAEADKPKIVETSTKIFGSNFSVLNPEDGPRKDNRLWFGNCSECGDRVVSDRSDEQWQHTIYEEKGYYSKEAMLKGGTPNTSINNKVDYCPTVTDGKKPTPLIYYIGEDGNRVYDKEITV